MMMMVGNDRRTKHLFERVTRERDKKQKRMRSKCNLCHITIYIHSILLGTEEGVGI